MAKRRRGRPPGEAGRRPDRAGVVRRRGPHADRRGGDARPGWRTSRCSRSRRPRSTAGWRRTRRRRPTQLKPGDRCLVVDVGGGTTDFSLIQAVEQQGELGFVRQAVGDHLLLGGDNMDLALAKFVETQAARGRPARRRAVRPADAGVPAGEGGAARPRARRRQHTVTVMGRGRPVIGGTLHAHADAGRGAPGHLRRLLPAGAARRRAAARRPGRPARDGPALRQRPGRHAAPGRVPAAATPHGAAPTAPDAILFNGGVFQPAVAARARCVEVHARAGTTRPAQPWQPLVLTNPSLDLAVAWGRPTTPGCGTPAAGASAAASPRSYYVGVERGRATAKPQRRRRSTVLCVVPQHLEEGAGDRPATKPELELALGQPVLFPLYTSTVRGDDKAGRRAAASRRSSCCSCRRCTRSCAAASAAAPSSVPVTLAARCTEIGTLELFCVAREGGNRWRLEFNVRDIVKDDGAGRATRPATEHGGVTDVWPEEPGAGRRPR